MREGTQAAAQPLPRRSRERVMGNGRAAVNNSLTRPSPTVGYIKELTWDFRTRRTANAKGDEA
ncbi:hypothetical protein Raf01_59640 [Rugosimonospora africana]|uniref:Uncharacterized protein n=1 Tax=Rugosimonospora africana TaxID=556532 RepID=A0A8J3QX94_9ACTN|nr:hypothetical protein Raf01_59640 [Rugosimonospora africana]